MKEELKISVVTVSYNAVDTIEETILSVINQTYDNIEYVIIDGGSTDGTVDIIRKYADGGSEALNHRHRITYWISEPDKGIYDAMNKGIAAATGDYINFMNAGDTFYVFSVIADIFNNEMDNAQVIYGSTFMRYCYGNYIVKPDAIEKITRVMPLCHQSVFVRLATIRQHPFRPIYGLAADHGSLLEIYKDASDSFRKYDCVIATYDAVSGISSRNALTGYQHEARVTAVHDSLFRRIRILVRNCMPVWVQIPLGRVFFAFNPRFKRIKSIRGRV